MFRLHRARCIAAVTIATLAVNAFPLGARSAQRFNTAYHRPVAPRIVFSQHPKKGPQIAVYSDGFAIVREGKRISNRYVTPLLARELTRPDLAAQARARVLQMLRSPVYHRPYVAGRVLVVLAPAMGGKDLVSVDRARLLAMRKRRTALALGDAPAYTANPRLNLALARLGADKFERLFKKYPRSEIAMLHARAMANGRTAPPVDLSNLYRVHVTASSVERAVRALAKLPGVEYVEPDWRVSTTLAQTLQIPDAAKRAAEKRALALAARPRALAIGAPGSGLPDNYGVESSMQGQLTAPGTDALAAYDEIERKFGELPGQGVRITNVSVGLLTGTEESAINNRGNDPCQAYYMGYGPTTRLIGNQRYIDWPGMPLIPTYVADQYGDLSGTALACGPSYDPELGEIGLDFSMMAPLPNRRQRAGATASGMLDLIGIAPGAKYRLVVPQTLDDVGNSDIMGAFLAAALQTPAPDVITASLGFGTDSSGFPGRYLEDDVLTESLIATIVNGLNVVVCISANDGLRTYTNAAVNPSGGSTPTGVAATKAQRTSIWDLGYSTAPSYDGDSGAIDVGGTTLDDISAANPLDPANRGLAADRRPYAETRWTGMAGFSSGFGSRVDVSAPSDNVLAMYRCWRSDEAGAPWPFCISNVANYNTVEEGLEGGTSAAAPEVAAAAAVAIQVARLTGHPFTNALDVRKFLIATATKVARVPQSDVSLNVGPQIDVRREVETLLAQAGKALPPGVARVDVMQRQSGLLTLELGTLDSAFLSDTDPAEIDLGAPYNSNDQPSNDNAYSPITIAPEWENVPAGARYRLYVAGKPNEVLSTAAYARLYPQEILAAAGDAFSGSGTRNVSLTYRAYRGLQKIAQTTFTIGFGPLSGTQTLMATAPLVAPVTRGATIRVQYDLTNVASTAIDNPSLVVSYPGRPNPSSSGTYLNFGEFIPLWSTPLTATKGTIDVPVSALQGGGIYGIGILLDGNGPNGAAYYSDFAYTRVAPSKTVARPAAPLLAMPGDTAFAHSLEIPYDGKFVVKYDVSNVPGATGAVLDVGAAGPTLYGSAQTFNNPNGSGPDDNGKDSGSVMQIPLSGTSGTITLSATRANLRSTMQNALRLIATAGGTPVGEDGEVSTIAEDGIAASDGGNIAYGFGANANGTDGMYASTAVAADGTVLSDVASFSQSTGATLTLLDNTEVDPPGFFDVPGFGLFPAHDTAFAMGIPLSGDPPQYYTLSSLSTNQYPYPTTVTMPALTPSQYVAENGTNYTDLVNAMAVVDASTLDTGEFSSFAQDMSVAPASQPVPPLLPVPASAYSFMYLPGLTAFDYDSQAKTGYMVIDDTQAPCAEAAAMPVIAAFNYATSGVTTQTLAGTYDGTIDFAVDSTTHVGVLSTDCPQTGGFAGFEFINLTTGSVQSAPVQGPPPGYPGMLAVDPVNHLVLAQLPLPDDLYSNENALSQVYVMDESGNVVKKLDGFASYASLLTLNHFFTVNPSTRRGFMMGPAVLDGGYLTYDPLGQIVVPQIASFSY